MSDPLPSRGVAVVYDGDCPLCAAYTRRLRLVAAAGEVHLFDARRHPDLRRSLAGDGLDPDRGMVVVVDGMRYHGARAVHVLAMLSGDSGALNRLGYRLFRSATLARVLYPVLAAGRRTLLALLGRPPLDGRP